MSYLRRSTKQKLVQIHNSAAWMNLGAGVTAELRIGTGGTDIEAGCYMKGFKGIFRNLKMVLGGAAGAAQTKTLTLMKNGGATALTVTIGGATDTIGIDAAHSVTATDTDDIHLQATSSVGAANTRDTWSLDFIPTD